MEGWSMGRCVHTFYTSAVQPVPTLICRLYKHLHTLRFDPSPSQRSFSNLLDSINENVQHLRPSTHSDVVSMGLVFRILVFSCTWGRFWSLGSVGIATCSGRGWAAPRHLHFHCTVSHICTVSLIELSSQPQTINLSHPDAPKAEVNTH